MEVRRGSIIITSEDPVGPVGEGLLGFLGSYPGSWRVHINQRLAAGWWSVAVSTEGFRRTLLVRPDEQTADGIIRQLREALRAPDFDCPPPPWDRRERRTRPRS